MTDLQTLSALGQCSRSDAKSMPAHVRTYARGCYCLPRLQYASSQMQMPNVWQTSQKIHVNQVC